MRRHREINSLTDQVSSDTAGEITFQNAAKSTISTVTFCGDSGLQQLPAGTGEAQARAIDVLSRQIKAQAYALAIADGFIVIGWMVVIYLVMMLFLKPARISYRDLRKMQ